MAEAQECQLCGGTDFELMDGLYFCIVCQSQSQQIREVVADQSYQENYEHNFALLIQEKVAKRVEPLSTINPSVIYEVYTTLLRLQAKALINLGAPEDIEDAILSLWMEYLAWKKVSVYQDPILLSVAPLSPNSVLPDPSLNMEPTIINIDTPNLDEVANDVNEGNEQEEPNNSSLLNERNEQEGNIFRRLNQDIQEEQNISSRLNEETEQEEQNNSYETLSNAENINSVDYFVKETGLRLSLTIAICYLGLIKCDSNVYLSDLLQLIIHGYVPFFDGYSLLPIHLQNSLIKSHFSREYSCHLSSHYFTATVVAKCLNFRKLVTIDASQMIARFLINVNLPSVFLPRILFIYDKVSKKFSNLFVERFKDYSLARLLPADLKVLSVIIISLKLTFGLDDRCEYILSDVAARKGSNCFVWTSWLTQMKLRWAVMRGETVDNVLKKNWFNYEDLTISKVIHTQRRFLSHRKLKHSPLKEELFSIFDDSSKIPDCQTAPTIPFFPLKRVGDAVDTNNFDRHENVFDWKIVDIFKHNFFDDSIEFLDELTNDVQQMLNEDIVDDDKKSKMFRSRHLETNNIIPADRYPCSKSYQLYRRLLVRGGFTYLRLEYLRQTDFSQTFDVVLSLFSGIISERPFVLFRAFQQIEEFLFRGYHPKNRNIHDQE